MPNPKYIEPDEKQQKLLNNVVKNLQPTRDISSLFHTRSVPETLNPVKTKQRIENFLADAEQREREAKPNSWQKDFAAGEVKMARKILEEMK